MPSTPLRASSHIASISSCWLSGLDGHSQRPFTAPLKPTCTRFVAAIRSANACDVYDPMFQHTFQTCVCEPMFQHTFQTWHFTPYLRQAARHSFSASPRVATSGETGSTFES